MERIGSHCTRRKRKIHGDLMFRAWGRKRVPGGGGTGKEKEEERKRVPSYSCAGSFLFLSYVLPASQRTPKTDKGEAPINRNH